MTVQEDWERAKNQAENMSPEELDKMIADFASGDWFRRLLQKQREREIMINVNKIPNRIRDPVDSFNDEECAKVFFEILHFADDLSRSKGMYVQLFKVNVKRLPDSEDEP